jgi:hypothetical protein
MESSYEEYVSNERAAAVHVAAGAGSNSGFAIVIDGDPMSMRRQGQIENCVHVLTLASNLEQVRCRG